MLVIVKRLKNDVRRPPGPGEAVGNCNTLTTEEELRKNRGRTKVLEWAIPQDQPRELARQRCRSQQIWPKGLGLAEQGNNHACVRKLVPPILPRKCAGQYFCFSAKQNKAKTMRA